MAKKRTDPTTTSGAARQTPAMYPAPAPVKLATPQKIVAVDLKSRTITIEGLPPPELVAIAEIAQRRLNLTARCQQYARTCLARIAPHWGERPKHISPAKWRNLEQRVKAMTELPATAPAEARDALKALHTLNRLVTELVEAGDWPESIERAICLAIDFGQLLQRGQTQIDHGKAVDRGKRSAKATVEASEAKHAKKNDRSELALAEYVKRMATVTGTRRKTDTLKQMSQVMGDDSKTPKWGSLTTLKRWSRDWKGITPTE